MKNISNQKWCSLSIKVALIDDLDFLYSQFYNYMIGATEDMDLLIFYFNFNN